MKELFIEVLELQKNWTGINTPEMDRRGIIIRDEIPLALTAFQKTILSSFERVGINLVIEGRDGTGPKSEVPWVRFASSAHSPNPREGWYCVYLFHAQSQGFYLALCHGSTRWINGEFKPRPVKELRVLIDWANSVLQKELLQEKSIVTSISLGSKGKLGKAYEAGTVAAIWYPKDNPLSDSKMSSDIHLFSKLLGKLYNAEDLGHSIESVNIEANLIQEVIQLQTGSKSGGKSGQGFGLTSPEKKAIEQHAMDIAEKHLIDLGYTLKNVSKNHPYDFTATKDGITMIVEVKGTTSLGNSIILTANEVLAHTLHHPNNILIVVHSIKLDRKSSPPRASGGVRVQVNPWLVKQETLKALSYQCLLSYDENI